ncbi:hypothetical protein BGLA2_1050003 [Burkholderia gladioli]|nr:hypothetical protein BGLA2_1050003 [Burkholderia gladioli]
MLRETREQGRVGLRVGEQGPAARQRRPVLLAGALELVRGHQHQHLGRLRGDAFLQEGLLGRGLAQAASGHHAVGAEEGLVEAHARQRQLRDRSERAHARGPHVAADQGHAQFRRGQHADRQQVVGHHVDVAAPRQAARQRRGGGAAVEEDRVAVLHVPRGRARDRRLLLAKALAPRVERFLGLVRAHRGGAAVGAQDAAFVGQRAQVPAHGGLGHAEMLAERGHVVHAGQHGLEHRLAAFLDFHEAPVWCGDGERQCSGAAAGSACPAGPDRHARRLIDVRTLALFFDRFDQGIPVQAGDCDKLRQPLHSDLIESIKL